MCGIFLVINNNINLDTTINTFKNLKNRGPDYNYHWNYSLKSNQIFLGQSTLSITGDYDVNNFVSDDYQILFNGEIYNYKEIIKNNNINISSDVCDTKFLLEYLIQNLNKAQNTDLDILNILESINVELDGMYVYVLYDKKNSKLYLSRDIQGEKNLYYYNNDSNLFIISSEISLILDYLKDNDIETEMKKDELNKYLFSRHHIYRKQTIYKDIYQIEPGETIIYDITSNTIKLNSVKGLDTLIDPELYHKNCQISFEDHLSNFDNLFRELSQNMIPSNHEYACIVSGGVDSTLSAYYFCHTTTKKPKYLIATNCIGKDKISDDLSLFEKELGMEIITIPITPEEYSKEINICQKVYQGPVPTHSAITLSILARKVKQLGIKVLFTGEGADEVFGGYSTYLSNNISSNELSEYFDNLKTNYSNYSKITNMNINLKNNDIKYQFKNELNKFWELSKNKYKFINTIETFYQASMLCDSLIQLPNVGLKSADLMCMNHGVESRTIFMRKPILKYILNSPIWLKLDFRTGYTKILLKELYLKYLPYRSLLPKQGFAGFPNESKLYLEQYKKNNKEIKNFNNDIKEYLNLKIDEKDMTRDVEWKLINMDYFMSFKFFLC